MKVRNGFVSNSSSSSFVILGKNTFIGNINPKTVSQGRIYAVGDEFLCDGEDVFTITEEMFKLLKETGQNGLKLYEAYAFSFDSEITKVITADLPKEFEIYSFEASYHSINNLEDFKEKYILKNE